MIHAPNEDGKDIINLITMEFDFCVLRSLFRAYF